MIRPVAAMAALALVTAQAWAQEVTLDGGVDEPADEVADGSADDDAKDGDAEDGDAEANNAADGDAGDGAVEEAKWPFTEATSWAVYASQVAPLLADLKQDRESGGQYARAPERGTEAVIQDVALAIRSQLKAKECWPDEDLVLAGRRETIAIAVRFGIDGRFVEEPRLVSPQDMPERDPALRRFIRRTFAALRACNVNGLTLPPKYYEDPIWVYFIVQSRPE
jgi:hypothetical protein